MSTQTRIPAGAPIGGRFAVSPLAQADVVLTDTARDVLAGEMSAIGFDLADSTAAFHAVATDPTRSDAERRDAVRTAIDTADDAVIEHRHGLTDEGTGVTGIAVELARDNDAVDAALADYATQDLEDGDEHLFGVDLAAFLYRVDRDHQASAWGAAYAAAPTALAPVTEADLDGYEPNDPKRAVLAEMVVQQRTARP